jgi:hypothetical protein
VSFVSDIFCPTRVPFEVLSTASRALGLQLVELGHDQSLGRRAQTQIGTRLEKLKAITRA